MHSMSFDAQTSILLSGFNKPVIVKITKVCFKGIHFIYEHYFLLFKTYI